MKQLFYTMIFFSIISCSSKSDTDYPYTFIDSKTETVGNNVNKMDLYTIPSNPSIDTLKMFCLEKKEEMSSGTFHYIVFFDFKENASFPINPMTAMYGSEEEPKKHIKAYYEYNRLNGYSKLNVYETNSWESVATTFDL